MQKFPLYVVAALAAITVVSSKEWELDFHDELNQLVHNFHSQKVQEVCIVICFARIVHNFHSQKVQEVCIVICFART